MREEKVKKEGVKRIGRAVRTSFGSLPRIAFLSIWTIFEILCFLFVFTLLLLFVLGSFFVLLLGT